MAEAKNYTQAGFDALQKELDYLRDVRRVEVKEEVAKARSYGDLSENSEYDEAKNEEAKIESRIHELEEMIAVSERTGRVLSVYQNRRWDGDYLTVKRILETGRIGEIARIESRIHGSRGIPKTWMRETRYEGGVLWDWGAHVIDQILALKPDKKVSYVSATMSHMTDADVEDGFTAHLIFEDEVEAIVEVGTNNLIPLPRWYLTGKKGSAMIRDFSSGAEIATLVHEETEEVLASRLGTGMTKMMVPRRAEEVHKSAMPVAEEMVAHDYYRNIAEVIDGVSEPYVKLSESLRVLRLMEAVKKAAITHETVWFEQE
jgi:predicted dehydrogenase